MSFLKKFIIFLSLVIVLSAGYYRYYYFKPLPNELTKLNSFNSPSFSDDLSRSSLIDAIGLNLQYLNKLPKDREISIGEFTYTIKDLIDSMESFRDIVITITDSKKMNAAILKIFDIFQSQGNDKKGTVLFTGYFEPVYNGSLKKSSEFKYPLYQKPDDIVKIDLGQFRRTYKGMNIFAKIKDGVVLPYDDRETIDSLGSLSYKGLELAWLADPVDVFFLHVQGSGIIKLKDGSEINVNYAGANGRDYRSIGGLLIREEKVTREEMSMQAIRKYLEQKPDEIERVLNFNESYVFFRVVADGPIGSTGVKVTAGRSVASDKKVFPKGGLAFLDTEEPIVDESGNVTGWKRIKRFVIDQDVGGAIKGPGRIDIFFGTGKEVGHRAGAMKREGQIYYLVKKRDRPKTN